MAYAFFQNIEFNDNWEFGSIGLDGKRPFGNSSVEIDILDIIGIKPDEEGDWTEEQYEYARNLYCVKLVPYLKKMCISYFE